jgi:hypothetical protein
MTPDEATRTLAEALHGDCLDEWTEKAKRDPAWRGTMHGPDAHFDRAALLIERSGSRLTTSDHPATRAGLMALYEALDTVYGMWRVQNDGRRHEMSESALVAGRAALSATSEPKEQG